MADKDELTLRALDRIANCTEPLELRRTANNAKSLGNDEVREAALRKLYHVSPNAEPGTLEHDVWQSIFALEGALKEERGKTTLPSRTRQKITRDGELKTVADLVTKAPSEGFRMLVDRGWPELTFEAVALRHPDRFERDVLESAAKRLDPPAPALSTAANQRTGMEEDTGQPPRPQNRSGGVPPQCLNAVRSFQ